MSPDTGPSTVNSLAFINPDDGAAIEYEGPFAFEQDGSTAEVSIPTDPDDYAGIHEGTADNLADREGHIGVALADASIEVSGVIESADVIEGALFVAINDGSRVDPSDVDVDLSEVHR